jgi:hypothetical protein
MKRFTAMMNTIGEVAGLGATVSFREAVRSEPGGPVAVVQAKDIGQDGTLDLSAVARVDTLPVKGDWPLLRPGDVLMQSRGTSYRSCIIPQGQSAMVAAGGLYVLHPDASRLDSRYLVVVLNLPGTQAALRKAATGSRILNITRDALKAIEIAVPPLADQRALVELGDLVRRSFEIEQRLYQLRLQQLHGLAIALTRRTEATQAFHPPSAHRSKRGELRIAAGAKSRRL